MILTICFDPVLENRYYVDKLLPGKESLANNKIYSIGGNGLINGRILNNLNIDVFATGFLGGLPGQYIFSKLKENNIYNEFVSIKDESRSSLEIFQNEQLLTKITEASPRITRDEVGSFYQVYNKTLDRFDIICGLGSLPATLSEDIYFDLISTANKNKKKFILQAEGKGLKYGIKAKPFMVKLTKNDLEYLSNLELDFENEIIKIGYSIIEEGVELVAIDLDERGSIILTRDKGYRLELDKDKINNLGQDKGYMVAGFAFGLYKNYDLETIMRLGQASRLVYAMGNDLDHIDMSDIKKFMSSIEIYKINY